MVPRPTNRMARFAGHVLAAGLPRPVRYLEIGAFEGATTAHVFKLLDGQLRITVIDPWLDYAELPAEQMLNAEQRFLANMNTIGATPVLRVLKGGSIEHLPALIANAEQFDLILIDGSHHALDVLADVALAWRLLTPGGLMVFDDYLYAVEHGGRQFRPKPAIDAFIGLMRRDAIVLDVAGQVFVRRRGATR